MGKKKGKKGPDEDTHRMITLEVVKARELKYAQRFEALKACLNYIDDILVQMEVLSEELRLQKNWEQYLSCDGLPKPYLPPEIRLFFEKLRFFETETIERNIDWTLSVDDRSILTQNIFRIDKTRETVKNELLPDFGGQYDKNINLALQVLKSIEYYLVDEKMVSKAEPRILDDITSQKKGVHDEINAFFDRYAYRVLCSEDAYMNDIDARTAEYFYTGTSFEMHIWTIKNVPIIFEFLENPFMIANLHGLKVKINVPFSILDDNLTIRGMHLDFDPFSEHAKSAEQKTILPYENLNAAITDLRDCLMNEWKMQVELQLEVRGIMLQKRLDYEEKKKQFEEEEIQRAKDKKNQKEDTKKKKAKPIKLPKEPPIVSDDEVPDIWNDFLKKENMEYGNFLNSVYHPDLLNLEWHEVNMKKYFPLGGIYQFEFVSKARHFDFNSFNMTWHENDGKLLIKNDISVQKIEQRTSERISQRKMSTTTAASIVSEYNPNESPWFVVTIELPEFMCLWGEPLPCHFEADVTGYIEEEKKETPILTEKGRSKKGHGHVTTVIPAGAPATVATVPLAEDRQSVASFLRGSIYSLSAVADRPSIYRLASTIADATIGPIKDIDLIEMGIDDFDLLTILKKSEIRNLERHCLPRIISSYKFPSEFSAEAKERSAKAKSAGGTLIRRHSLPIGDDKSLSSPIGEIDKEENNFTTLQQHDPERMFPLFTKAEHVNIVQRLLENADAPVPTTFYELIKRLDMIKRYYLNRPMRTVRVLPFKPHMRLLRPPQRAGSHVDEALARARQSARSLQSHASGEGLTTRRESQPSPRRTVEHRKSVTVTPEQQKLVDETISDATKEDEEDKDDKDEEKDKDLSTIDHMSTKQELEVVDTRKTFKFSRWTTKYIKHFELDRENRLLTIWADRLGVFGLAYKRYEHFPFRYWSLEPSEENPESEVVFTLETQYVKVVLYITGDGVRGYVTDLSKKFVRNRPMYLVIEEPLKDFRELRKRFREKNLNIFTEHDASFYIENGYFSQKHLSTELHTYLCMCSHALLMRFSYSEWNRLASRRDLIFRLLHHKESEEYICTVRIKPEEATFVTIKELCSDDLNVFNLEYTLTWRNIDFYADLHHLITSMYPSAPEQRVKNPLLVYFIKALLWEVRPLSFS